ERVLQLIVRIGEQHLLAAFRGDVHAGGDQVETAGSQARDQRTPFGQDRLDRFDAHLLEDFFDNFWRLTRDAAVGGGIGEGRFVGITDANAAVFLDVVEGIGVGQASERNAAY